jgi:hypothetical protein
MLRYILAMAKRATGEGIPSFRSDSAGVLTVILAVIGGITLILTTARVPAALAEFLRACILMANAARELRAALAKRIPRDDSTLAEQPSSRAAEQPSSRAAERRGLRTY